MYIVENIPYFQTDIRALEVLLGHGEITEPEFHAGMNALERQKATLDDLYEQQFDAAMMELAHEHLHPRSGDMYYD